MGLFKSKKKYIHTVTFKNGKQGIYYNFPMITHGCLLIYYNEKEFDAFGVGEWIKVETRMDDSKINI